MERVDLDGATEFLLIAATLVELKARRLLPGPRRHRARRGAVAVRGARPPARAAARLQDVPGRGEGAARAARRRRPQSVARTRRARGAVPVAGARSARAGRRSTRSSPRPRVGPGARSRSPRSRTDHVAPIRASVRDAIETVLALLPATGAVRFRDLTIGAGEKLEVIVRFLAVLELFKQGVDRPRAGRELRRARGAAARARRARRARPLSIADSSGEPIDRADDRRIDDDDERDRAGAPDRRRGARVTHRRTTSIDVEARARDRGGRARGDRAGAARRCSRSSSSCRPTRVEELCDELAAEYEREGRGFQLARVAGGYRFQTHPDAYAYVERFVLEGQTARLSGPALETLAIVAYKQPIARAQISAIRGVNVDATLKTLVARGYVEESRARARRRATRRCSRTTTRVPRAARARLARPSSRRSPTSCPSRVVVEALERGLRGVDVGARRATGRHRPSRSRARSGESRERSRLDASDRRTASGCRRCSRAPASGRAARARC